MPEELLTINEAASLLRRSRAGLYLMLGRGEITAVKVGSRSLIKRAELDRLIGAAPVAVVKRREREACHAA